MAQEGEEEEEEWEYDFPAELDELLEYCVGQHGEDFEAISRDFLDIASELDETLAERAHEFFSPDNLRERWAMLTGTEVSAGAPDAAASAATSAAASAAAVPTETAAPAEKASPAVQLPSDVSELPEEERPSGFSVFADSLKGKIDDIYSEVQSRLPSAVPAASDEEDESDEDAPGIFGGAAPAADDSKVVPPIANVSVEAVAAAEAAVPPVEVQSPTAQEEELRQKTLKLFGTDDLSKILTMGGAAPIPVAGGATQHISADVANFEAVLLSHGVNPTDIEGPLVQPPPLFAALRQSLEKEPGSSSEAAAPPAPAKSTAPGPAAAPKASSPPVAKAKAGGEKAAKAEPVAASPNSVGRRSLGKDVPATSPDESEGDDADDDSADEDFAKARHAMKNASKKLVVAQEGSSAPASSPAPKKMAFAPPPRAAASSSPAKPTQESGPARPPQKFVKLDLVESSSEEDDAEAEGEEAPGSSEDDDSEASEPQEPAPDGKIEVEPIKVIRRLLRRAPDGDCPWDIWLSAAREWPRLQIRLGQPNFYRRGDDLRVSFSAEMLREARDEELRERQERRRKKAESAERIRNGAAEFIKEAERRREMLGGRLGGGFVCKSDKQEKEEEERKQRELEEEAAKERAAAEKAEKAAIEEKARKSKAEEAARLEAEQKEAKKKRLEEEAAKARSRQKEEEVASAKASLQDEKLRRVVDETQLHRFSLCDKQVSVGPPLPALPPHLEALLSAGKGEDSPYGVGIVPWGEPGCGGSAPSAAQREALGLLHAKGLTESLVLVPGKELKATGAPESVHAYAAAVLVIMVVAAVSDRLKEVLPCGKALSEVLVCPLPLLPLAALFRRPLALWASEEGRPPSGLGMPSPSTEMVCVAMRGRSQQVQAACGDEALAVVLEEVHDEGLSIVGMRLAFPDERAARAVSSAALRGTVRAGEPVLLLAIRGPHALATWRSLLGPADPNLARMTDPSSLNARFGGQSRQEAVSLAPPSSNARANVDMAWAFGGRLDADAVEVPQSPLHVVSLQAPEEYALELAGSLTFAAAGALLGGLLLRAGQVLSLAAGGLHHSKLIATAVREGGGAFAPSCRRLLSAPPADLLEAVAGADAPSSPPGSPAAKAAAAAAGEVLAKSCVVPGHHGRHVNTTPSAAAAPALEEACKLGEPEVLIVGVRPRGGSAASSLLFRRVLDGLHARFGPQGRAPHAHDVGGCTDLLAVRLLSLGRGGTFAGTDAELPLAAAEALRGFRNFAQMMRRAPEQASDGWWLGDEAGGLTALIALRGEGLLSKFQAFLAKEWKLSAATNGDVLFSPTIQVARQTWHVFFGHLRAPLFAPTLPLGDLRSSLRFLPPIAAASEDSKLLEAALFPQRLSPQLSVAIVLPPKADSVQWRALTAAGQQGFSLAGAFVAGGLSAAAAAVLFDQEVADGHLEPGDRGAFMESVGAPSGDTAGEEEEESRFRCVWLVLSRHQAVKRMAQLCGHGDPAVNQEHLFPSLRSGRDRVHNGIRCATSLASADALIGTIVKDLGPSLMPPPLGSAHPARGLGVEATERVIDCALVAVALASADDEGGLAHVVREVNYAITEHGLSVVGMHAADPATVAPPPAGQQHSEAEEQPADDSPQRRVSWAGGSAAAAELRPLLALTPERKEQLVRWKDARPSATPVVDLACQGGPLLLLAVEGPASKERCRQAVTTVANAAANKGSLVWYTSGSPAEATADVVHFFSELPGARHYIVEGGA